jgi:hypothetical protein
MFDGNSADFTVVFAQLPFKIASMFGPGATLPAVPASAVAPEVPATAPIPEAPAPALEPPAPEAPVPLWPPLALPPSAAQAEASTSAHAKMRLQIPDRVFMA